MLSYLERAVYPSLTVIHISTLFICVGGGGCRCVCIFFPKSSFTALFISNKIHPNSPKSGKSTSLCNATYYNLIMKRG